MLQRKNDRFVKAGRVWMTASKACCALLGQLQQTGVSRSMSAVTFQAMNRCKQGIMGKCRPTVLQSCPESGLIGVHMDLFAVKVELKWYTLAQDRLA